MAAGPSPAVTGTSHPQSVGMWEHAAAQGKRQVLLLFLTCSTACCADASVFFGFQACISSACSASCSLPCAWEVLLQLRVCAPACSAGSFLLFLLLHLLILCCNVLTLSLPDNGCRVTSCDWHWPPAHSRHVDSGYCPG